MIRYAVFSNRLTDDKNMSKFLELFKDRREAESKISGVFFTSEYSIVKLEITQPNVPNLWTYKAEGETLETAMNGYVRFFTVQRDAKAWADNMANRKKTVAGIQVKILSKELLR